MDKKLTFAKQTEIAKIRTMKYIKILYPLINRRSKLHIKNKLLIFKNIFRPMITYASPVWGDCANCHINKLQIAQNKCLKIILNKPHYYNTKRLHNNANITFIKQSINIQTNSFLTKCAFSSNPLISNLAQ